MIPDIKPHSHQHEPRKRSHACEDIEQLKIELEQESKGKHEAELKYSDLNREVELFQIKVDECKLHPESKYDPFIDKQTCINDNLVAQVKEAHEKLANLTNSLKNIQVCGKECNLNTKDLMLNYDCMSKGELTKEVRRFERMHIDLKSNLDRLQWRLDCESKIYYNLLDQYQKLQVELYYLKNLSEKYGHHWHH